MYIIRDASTGVAVGLVKYGKIGIVKEAGDIPFCEDDIINCPFNTRVYFELSGAAALLAQGQREFHDPV